MNAQSFRDRIAAHFKAKPDCWIDAVVLEAIGGRFAWRTRVSECRVGGMDIRNRQRRQTDAQGRRWTTSEYCYVPPAEREADEWDALFAVAERREGIE